MPRRGLPVPESSAAASALAGACQELGASRERHSREEARAAELERTIQILARRQKNNPARRAPGRARRDARRRAAPPRAAPLRDAPEGEPLSPD